MASRIRVLALVDVLGSPVAECRVVAPLRALAAAGRIAGFSVTDASLRGAPRTGTFDVVWLQRGADAWLSRALAARLPGGYLMDVDDHLLCRPSYLQPHELPAADAVTGALDACGVLTTTSARLGALLARRSGVDLATRTHVCVNAAPFTAGLPVRSRPPHALLLAQAHRTALDASRDELLTALAESAARHHLPLWTIGDSPRELGAAAARAGARVERLQTRSWAAYHRALAGPPTLLGLAPLETRGDAATLEFVAGKSDVKMMEYGGYAQPAVYSAAPPYRDTDLTCGRVVANTHEAWTAAIDDLLADGWREAPAEAREVRARRDIRRVAEEQWWPALLAARLETPVRAAWLFGGLDRARARARDRVARARWRLRR